MNVRLLGALLTVIGLVFALHAYTEGQKLKSALAGMDIQDYYRKTTGAVFREDLVGVSRGDLKQDLDTAKSHKTWGFMIAALGFVIVLAGQSPRRERPKTGS